MTTSSSWLGGSGDWSDAADWSAGVPDSKTANATIAASGDFIVTVGSTESFKAGNVTLDAAAATLDVAGTLDLTGTCALTAGSLLLAGTISGGTIDNADGGFVVGPYIDGDPYPLLEGVTFDGSLTVGSPSTASNLEIENGLTIAAAGGIEAGTITLENGASMQFGGGDQTLANAAITVNGNGSGIAVPQGSTLTLASNVVINGGTGGIFSLNGGGGLINNGDINVPEETLSLQFDAGLVNNGTMAVFGDINDTNILNNSVIESAGGTLVISGQSVLPMTVVNNGTLLVAADSSMSFLGGKYTNLTNFQSGTLTSGAFVVDTGGALSLAVSQLLTTDDAAITLDGVGSTITSQATAGKAKSIDQTLTNIGEQGTLELTGGRNVSAARGFTDNGILLIGGNSDSVAASVLTISQTGTVIGSGGVTGSVVNSGLVSATGGELSLGPISGTGTLRIDADATLVVAFASGQSVDFAGADALLNVGVSASLTGPMSGFAAGDTLELEDMNFLDASQASYVDNGQGTGGVLTVTDGTHTAAITVVGEYLGDTFETTDLSGRVAVTLIPAVHWASAVNGAFSTASDWTGDAVPGSGSNAALDASGAAFRVTSDVSQSVLSLQTASNATLWITGGTFTVADGTGDGANAGAINVRDGATLAIAGRVTGPGAMGVDSTGDASSLTAGAAGADLSGGTLTVVGAAALVEASGGGLFTISEAIANGGMLEADGGDLAVDGAVTGAGSAVVDGGVLTVAAAFNQDVAFTGASGTLALGDSQDFTGSIAGFSAAGGDLLDLGDIAFTGPDEASFVDNGHETGGVLTLSDGSHTAAISLVGDYVGATFLAAADGHGGLTVTTTAPAHWLSDSSGLFDTPAAWSTGSTPDASDDASLDASGGADYTVSVTDAVVASIQTAANATLAVAFNGNFKADDGTGAGENAGTIYVGNSHLSGDQPTFSFSGTISNSGFIRLRNAQLYVYADGVLAGGGNVDLVQSEISGADLVNLSDKLVLNGRGDDVVDVEVGLTNAVGGLITTVGPATVTLMSSGTIDNAGDIHGVYAGLVVEGAINNTGQLMAAGGSLTVAGAVTGDGVDRIVRGGTLALDSSFTQDVRFAVHGPSGVLQLAQSQGYTGTIYGFSTTGSTALDLRDIAFVGAGEATFAGGVLTVTDGTHTAHIHLSGNFKGSTFVASSDGGGGVIIVDPGAASSQAAALTSAMASFVVASASVAPSSATTASPPSVVAVPGAGG